MKVGQEHAANYTRYDSQRPKHVRRIPLRVQTNRRRPAMEALGKRLRRLDEMAAVSGVDQTRTVLRMLNIEKNRVKPRPAPRAAADQPGQLRAVTAIDKCDLAF